MHPEILSITLFGIVAAFTPGPNNFVAFYSGFNFGILRTLPHIIGVTFGFPFFWFCLAIYELLAADFFSPFANF